MANTIQPDFLVDWETETAITLTESEWLQVKCVLVNAMHKHLDDGNHTILALMSGICKKIDAQRKNGIIKD